MSSSTAQLTTEQTDELILAACTTNDGAIEDGELAEDTATYFFESGAVGTVDRVTVAVQIQGH